jgi:large subunit ribosomal protein L10
MQPAGARARRHTVDRADKKQCVASLTDVFKTTSVVVVAHYSGLSVVQMQALRKQMRAAGATVRIAKNRLVKIALRGTEAASISELMRGPTLIAYSDDPVAAPKAAVAFAKNYDKLVILGGAMGATALDLDAVRSLATLPSLDELRGKLVGLIQAPAARLARLATAPSAKLVRVFSAYSGKDVA